VAAFSEVHYNDSEGEEHSEDEFWDEDYGEVDDGAGPSTGLAGRAILTVELEVENRFDHTDDIFSTLQFTAVLLCNGLMVAAEAVQSTATRRFQEQSPLARSASFKFVTAQRGHSVQPVIVYFDLSWVNMDLSSTQPQYVKSIFSAAGFCSPNNNREHNASASAERSAVAAGALICGLPWQASLGTHACDIDGLHVSIRTVQERVLARLRYATLRSDDGDAVQDSDAPGSVSWTTLQPSAIVFTPDTKNEDGSKEEICTATSGNISGSKWTLVVIGSTAAATAWSEAAYPLGFVEMDVTEECNRLLAGQVPSVGEAGENMPVLGSGNDGVIVEQLEGMVVMAAGNFSMRVH
jgi:hypothetical protein